MTLAQQARALIQALSAERRRHLALLLGVGLAAALFELAMIALSLPVLLLLVEGADARLPAPAAAAARLLGDPLLVLPVALAAIALLLAGLRLAALRIGQSFAAAFGRDLSVSVFERVLSQPYPAYTRANSSRLLAAIERSERLIPTVMQPLVGASVAAVLALFIVAGMALLSWRATLALVLIFAVAYVTLGSLTRRSLHSNSRIVAESLTARLQLVREALGGIRDVILEETRALYLDSYRALEQRNRDAQRQSGFYANIPRIVVEALVVAALAAAALFALAQPEQAAAGLPLAGALLVATQRLLPLIQQIWLGWALIASNRKPVDMVFELLSLPVDQRLSAPSGALGLRKQLAAEGVHFAHLPGRPVFTGIDLAIPAGRRVAILGESGAGKTSLIDLLTGLLRPDSGRIAVDGGTLEGERVAAWQASIGHVPQTVYLTDASIARNITLGRERDEQRLRHALDAAQLSGFVDSLPDGAETQAGERGVRMSAGQRQRVGIARAIYKGATVLFLDEATSALDPETESAVLAGLAALGPDYTLIMTAHRPAVAEFCDEVIDLGRIGASPVTRVAKVGRKLHRAPRS